MDSSCSSFSARRGPPRGLWRDSSIAPGRLTARGSCAAAWRRGRAISNAGGRCASTCRNSCRWESSSRWRAAGHGGALPVDVVPAGLYRRLFADSLDRPGRREGHRRCCATTTTARLARRHLARHALAWPACRGHGRLPLGRARRHQRGGPRGSLSFGGRTASGAASAFRWCCATCWRPPARAEAVVILQRMPVSMCYTSLLDAQALGPPCSSRPTGRPK